MGESTNACATLRFDRRIRLEFHGATITSDAGLLACRELDDALGLTETADECLQESRGGRNVQHRLVGLLRQSVYSRLAGYEDTNDAERLADDPTMRVVVGDRGIDRPAASTNTMSRFETEVLTQDGNVEGLGRLNAEWVDGAMSRTPHRRVILDMDSSESPVHGEQEGASYNGHFGSTCYHPLFVFNQFGDCEGAMLRAGNVHSAHEWRQVLEPILSRYEEKGVRRYFRADAAFAKPDIYEYLEERRVFYAIRLPSNKVLQYEIAPLLIRPVGRPPKRPVILYDDFWYRAGSWDRARRVVAKVEWHRGELFPRVGFIVTNMTAGPEGVVRFYNGRGTAEQWIKEGKYAYERQQDETQEEHIELVEAREDAPKALQPSEQPLDLVAPLVQLLVVFPWVDSGREWGNNGSKSQLQCELARLVALVCTIHHYRQVLLLRPQAVEQLAALRCVVGLSRGKGEGHGRSSICGNHMNLGGPAATRLSDGLWPVFFNAPVPSGCTLTIVLSIETASSLTRTICSRCRCSNTLSSTPFLAQRFMRV